MVAHSVIIYLALRLRYVLSEEQPVSQILQKFIVTSNVSAVFFSLSGISPSDLVARWCHPIVYLIVPATHLCIEPQTEPLRRGG